MTQTHAEIYAVPRIREVGPQAGHAPTRIYVFRQLPGVDGLARKLCVGELAMLERNRSGREGATVRVPRWIFTAEEIETMRAHILEARKRLYANRCESRKQRNERISAGAKRKKSGVRMSPRVLERVEEAAQLRFAELGRTIEEHRAWAIAAYAGEPARQQAGDPDDVRLDRAWVRREVAAMATRRTGSSESERCDEAPPRITQAESRRMRVPGAICDPCISHGKGMRR